MGDLVQMVTCPAPRTAVEPEVIKPTYYSIAQTETSMFPQTQLSLPTLRFYQTARDNPVRRNKRVKLHADNSAGSNNSCLLPEMKKKIKTILDWIK